MTSKIQIKNFWKLKIFTNMLISLWLLYSLIIAFLELLAASQPEWIVQGGTVIQGLYAVCKYSSCRMRSTTLSALMMLSHLVGALLLLVTTLLAAFIVWGANSDRKMLIAISKTQCLAGKYFHYQFQQIISYMSCTKFFNMCFYFKKISHSLIFK